MVKAPETCLSSPFEWTFISAGFLTQSWQFCEFVTFSGWWAYVTRTLLGDSTWPTQRDDRGSFSLGHDERITWIRIGIRWKNRSVQIPSFIFQVSKTWWFKSWPNERSPNLGGHLSNHLKGHVLLTIPKKVTNSQICQEAIVSTEKVHIRVRWSHERRLRLRLWGWGLLVDIHYLCRWTKSLKQQHIKASWHETHEIIWNPVWLRFLFLLIS